MSNHSINMHLATWAGLSPVEVNAQCVAVTGVVIDYFSSASQLRVLQGIAKNNNLGSNLTPEQIAFATGYVN